MGLWLWRRQVSLLTGWAHSPPGTGTAAIDWVAASSLQAFAPQPAVGSIVACLAFCITSGSCLPWWAEAFSCGWVARTFSFTVTRLLTIVPKCSRWTFLLTMVAMETCWANTLSTCYITPGSILAVTGVSTIKTMKSSRAFVFTSSSIEPFGALTGPRQPAADTTILT